MLMPLKDARRSQQKADRSRGILGKKGEELDKPTQLDLNLIVRPYENHQQPLKSHIE